MNLSLKSFLIRSTIMSTTILTTGAILYSTVLEEFYLPILPWTLIFFYALTNLVHSYLLKIAGNTLPKFTARFMGATFVKIFIYLAFAVIYILTSAHNGKVFLINFLILYILFTTFEVRELIKVTKKAK